MSRRDFGSVGSARRLHALTLVLAAAAAVEARAAEPWYAGPWLLEYRASAGASEGLRADDGATFAEYNLQFASRSIVHVDDKPALSLVDAAARFDHRARWTAADATQHDYFFAASGKLTADGEFNSQGVALKLSWVSGAGRGTSDAQEIVEPVGEHRVEGQWLLKRRADRPKQEGGPATNKMVFAASRTSQMPQQLAGCPPLELHEWVVLRQPDVADLELAVKELKRPEAGGVRYTLFVAVKNLGPDGSRGARMEVVLPEGATPRVEGDDVLADGRRVTLWLPSLAADESTEVVIPFWLDAPPDPQDPTSGIVLVEISSPAHDPHVGNNGLLERLAGEAD